MDMSVDAISKLGWIETGDTQNIFKDDNNSPLKKGVIFKNEMPYTLRTIEKKDYIKFKRNVRGGYSNITLEMMMKFANKEAPDNKLFDFDEDAHFVIPSDLKTMSNVMVSKAGNASFSKRIWIRPSESEYRKLRMKYIHFTCTSDENYHLNNPFNFKGVHTLEGTMGNLGNTPNFDLEGRLCRIVYHSDDSKPDNVVDALHYMYEYGTSGSVPVKCNVVI